MRHSSIRIKKRTARWLVLVSASLIACALAFAIGVQPGSASPGIPAPPLQCRDPVCGNGACEGGGTYCFSEDPQSCPQDCKSGGGDGGGDGGGGGQQCNNDGVCNPEIGEWNGNCSGDCPSFCGDQVCKPDEVDTCPDDCPVDVTCGDGLCSAFEDKANCPKDCANVTEEPTQAITNPPPQRTEPPTEEPTEERPIAEPTDEPTPDVTEEIIIPLPGDEPTEEAIVEPTPEPPDDLQGFPRWLILLVLLGGGLLGFLFLFLIRRRSQDDETESQPGPPQEQTGPEPHMNPGGAQGGPEPHMSPGGDKGMVDPGDKGWTGPPDTPFMPNPGPPESELPAVQHPPDPGAPGLQNPPDGDMPGVPPADGQLPAVQSPGGQEM